MEPFRDRTVQVCDALGADLLCYVMLYIISYTPDSPVVLVVHACRLSGPPLQPSILSHPPPTLYGVMAPSSVCLRDAGKAILASKCPRHTSLLSRSFEARLSHPSERRVRTHELALHRGKRCTGLALQASRDHAHACPTLKETSLPSGLAVVRKRCRAASPVVRTVAAVIARRRAICSSLTFRAHPNAVRAPAPVRHQPHSAARAQLRRRMRGSPRRQAASAAVWALWRPACSWRRVLADRL